MEGKGDLHELLKTKDEQIKQLQRIVVEKDEEIEQLKSQLDKFQSVLPKALVQPRKVRAQGISAEPQTARSIKDCVANNALRKYTKSNR
jgi:cGMP-dependent protein kinase